MTTVRLNEFEIVWLAESGIGRDDYFPGPLVIVDADMIIESRAERREFDTEVAGLQRNWRRCEVSSCNQRQLLRKG